MSWKFLIIEEIEPFPNIKQIRGEAIKENIKTKFFLTISPFAFLLSVEPNDNGLKLIEYFSSILGKPLLKYRDKHKDYSDYTAEWYIFEDKKFLKERLALHSYLGFESEKI